LFTALRDSMRSLEKIAKSYVKLLNLIDWSDPLLVAGIKEGLNKFLSNAFLKEHPNSKYLQGDFYTLNAIQKIKSSDFSGLVYEHMVPKGAYIQKVCEQKAAEGSLDYDFVVDLLNKYWKIAVVTKDEDRLLLTKRMPNNWDGVNIFYRYHKANICLINNPFISNEDQYDSLPTLMNIVDRKFIANTNGETGTVSLIDGSLVITSKDRSYKYQSSATLTDVFYDGWYLA